MNSKKRTVGFIVILSTIFLLSFACTLYHPGRTESRFSTKDTRQIAVLDFEQEGFLGGEKIGRFAADELTTALFLTRKINVVDRAQVRAKVLEKNLSSSILNADAVREIGISLGADYLILGKITQLSGQNYEPEHRKKLSVQITFRVLSSKHGTVAGIVSRRSSKKEEPKKIISHMLRKMAKSVRLE